MPIIVPYEKSFATHCMAKLWSNENDVRPEDVFMYTKKDN